jgi:hypothetical protein
VETPSPSPPKAAWTVGLALVSAALFTWPLVLRPFAIYGHPHGETDNHLWMFWRATRQLVGSGPVANLPEGLPLPLMDPINLPLALPGFLVDPALGYGGLVMGNVLLGMVAGYFLARQLVGPRAAWVAMVAIGCSPFLSGAMEFGITESWPVWALAAHLGFLLRYARGEGAGWRDALAAGLCLGAFALSGWYHAFFGLLVEAVIAPWLAWRHRRWKGVLGQGALAALLVLPALLRFLAIRALWTGRWHLPGSVPRAHLDHWRWLRNYGTDLLNLVLPSLEPAPISLSVYLGLGATVLALLGWWWRRRALTPFLLATLVLLTLALGHWVRVGGEVLIVAGHPVPGPARLLVQLVPPLVGLSHWHRAVGPATVLLGLMAAVGAQRLIAGRSWRALLLVSLLLAESLFLGQTRWPRSVYTSELPSIYEALEAPGAVLELPFDNGRVPFSQTPARLLNRWQVFHGRPVAENYEGRDAILALNRLAAVADRYCGVPPTRPPHELPPPSMLHAAPLEEDGALAGEVRGLSVAGFTWVVLHRDRAKTPDRAQALLERALGVPDLRRGEAVAWRIHSTPEGSVDGGPNL